MVIAQLSLRFLVDVDDNCTLDRTACEMGYELGWQTNFKPNKEQFVFMLAR